MNKFIIIYGDSENDTSAILSFISSFSVGRQFNLYKYIYCRFKMRNEVKNTSMSGIIISTCRFYDSI